MCGSVVYCQWVCLFNVWGFAHCVVVLCNAQGGSYNVWELCKRLYRKRRPEDRYARTFLRCMHFQCHVSSLAVMNQVRFLAKPVVQLPSAIYGETAKVNGAGTRIALPIARTKLV